MRLALREMALRGAARIAGLPLGDPNGLELPPPSLDDARAWLN